MAKKLTDLSQLTKAILKESPPPRAEPAPVPRPEPMIPEEDREATEVLAYFSRPSQNAPQRSHVVTSANPSTDRVAELKSALDAKDAELDALAEEKSEADRRIAELERQLAAEREAHVAAVRERNRLQGECGRLQGELRKSGQQGAVPVSLENAPVVQSEPTKPAQGILAAPAAIDEAFSGELREQVLATLREGLEYAEQSGRERRAELLRRLLAVNAPSGELDCRRAELKQILKDAGYFNDPKPLEKLGFRLISGRTHWKLQYMNVRITMSKTPSDYRANLNTASDTANRCF